MALESILVSGHKLTTLDVSGLTSLTTLWAELNQLTSIDITGCKALTHLNAMNNHLTTFDLSSCGCSTNKDELYGMMVVRLMDNSLQTVFLKSGTPILAYFDNNPDLVYICTDEDLIEYYREELSQQNINKNLVINSYCTFTLGGDYNIVTGKMSFDSDTNGCDDNDKVISNLKININDGVSTRSAYVNQLGDYIFYAQETNITLTPFLENPDYFTVTPSSVALNALEVNGITQTQDFCVTANGIHNDLEIIIAPIGIARPGFDAKYKIIYKNKGTQILSGDVIFDFKDSFSDFVSASITPNNQKEDYLTWSYLDLQPLETRTIDVVFNVNSPMETPAVNDGDLLSFIATITPEEGDSYIVDNTFAMRQKALNSLDPNDITCLEGKIVSPTKIGEYLHYNINFENVGTASAINIVVKDMIDADKFDVSSLQVMYTSHAMNTKVTENKLEFIFENINLEAKQHGNVTFKIKTKKTLQTGDSVMNNADIFFDYNFPVVTNDEITTFQALSKTEFKIDNSICIYPNAAKDFVNITANDFVKSIQMYDFQGRIIKTSLINENLTKFDISNYANGIYFLKVQTEKGSKIEKIIKK